MGGRGSLGGRSSFFREQGGIWNKVGDMGGTEVCGRRQERTRHEGRRDGIGHCVGGTDELQGSRRDLCIVDGGEGHRRVLDDGRGHAEGWGQGAHVHHGVQARGGEGGRRCCHFVEHPVLVHRQPRRRLGGLAGTVAQCGGSRPSRASPLGALARALGSPRPSRLGASVGGGKFPLLGRETLLAALVARSHGALRCPGSPAARSWGHPLGLPRASSGIRAAGRRLTCAGNRGSRESRPRERGVARVPAPGTATATAPGAGSEREDGRRPSPVAAPNPGPKTAAALPRTPPRSVPRAPPVPDRCPRLTRHGPGRPRGPTRCPPGARSSPAIARTGPAGPPGARTGSSPPVAHGDDASHGNDAHTERRNCSGGVTPPRPDGVPRHAQRRCRGNQPRPPGAELGPRAVPVPAPAEAPGDSAARLLLASRPGRDRSAVGWQRGLSGSVARLPCMSLRSERARALSRTPAVSGQPRAADRAPRRAATRHSVIVTMA